MAADALNNRLKSIEKTMQTMSKNTANINSAMQGLTTKFQSLGNKIISTNKELKKTATILQDISMKLDGMGDPLGGASSKQSTKDYIDMVEKIGRIRVKNEETISSNRAKWKKISMAREDELIKGRRLQEVMSRANLPLLGLITEQISMRQQDVSGRMSRIGELETKPKRGRGASSKAEKQELKELIAERDKGGFFQKFNDVFEKNFGKGSAWDKAFAGHGKVAAGGIAMGGVGAAMGLSKKIIDSSPLMQQMLKIINFGFTLLLRPIGDFFGMILRPIVLLLLRKFIIPFYQTVYPWFLQTGKKLGDDIAASLDIVADIPKILVESGKVLASDLTAVLDPKKADDTKINPIKKVIEKIAAKIPAVGDMKVLGKLPINPLGTFGASGLDKNAAKIIPETFLNTKLPKITEVLAKVATPIVKILEAPAKLLASGTKAAFKVNQTVTKAAVDLATAGKGGKVIESATSKATAPIKKIAEMTATKIGASTASKFIPVVGQALLAIDVAGSALKKLEDETGFAAYSTIRGGALGLGSMLGDTEGVYTEHALDFLGFGKESTAEQIGGMLNTLTGGAVGGNNYRGGKNKMATGGIINEPIFGVGQSGRTYSFGERGAEAVTPLGQGTGTTVNVTVNGSIYSDKDMLNFQRTIMRAIETSNTRRAKI